MKREIAYLIIIYILLFSPVIYYSALSILEGTNVVSSVAMYDKINSKLRDVQANYTHITAIELGYYVVSGKIIVILGFGGGTIEEEYKTMVELHWYPHIQGNTYNITFEITGVNKEELLRRFGLQDIQLDLFVLYANDTIVNSTVLYISVFQNTTRIITNVILPLYFECLWLELKTIDTTSGEENLQTAVELSKEKFNEFTLIVADLEERIQKLNYELEKYKEFNTTIYRIFLNPGVYFLYLMFSIFLIGLECEIFRDLTKYYYNLSDDAKLALAIFTTILDFIAILTVPVIYFYTIDPISTICLGIGILLLFGLFGTLEVACKIED